MWSCLRCDYLYEVANRGAADNTPCPKCGKYQMTGKSLVQDVADGHWNPANGFFFGSPIGKGIIRGILVVILLGAVRAVIGNRLGVGEVSQRFVQVTVGIGASATLSYWLGEVEKRNSTGGYWFCAIVYGFIALCVTSTKGIWWGLFWFVYPYWDGCRLLIEIFHR